MPDDYIKRGDVIREFAGVPNDLYYTSAIVAALEKVPASDVEPKCRWIPVTERLPENHQSVIVHRDDGGIFIWEYFGESPTDECWIDDYSNVYSAYTVTHWMPLPEPPEEEKEENMDKYTIAEEAYKRGYADGLREAGKPRVLGYDEIEGSDAVWLEIRHTNGIEIEVTAFKTCGERMMGFEHGFFQSIPLYGKQWRCWSKKPTREQMEKEEWKK